MKTGKRQGGAVRNAAQQGFTLLELLVATAILGTAVAALLSLLSGSLSNARRLQAPEQALRLARSQMQELLLPRPAGGSSLPAVTPDGSWQGRWNERFRWEARTSRVAPVREPLPGEPVLVRIELTAFWKDGAAQPEKQLALETYQLWQAPARSVP